MSGVNVKRAVDNIRTGTSAYTPLVEVIVNGLQAIDERGHNGKVLVRVMRNGQAELDGSLPPIVGFEVEDDGVGFNDRHRESFDTLYTDAKIQQGGKGFGRFTCLKYFEDVRIRSVYLEGDAPKRRTFRMGMSTDIIVDEEVVDAPDSEPGSIIELRSLRKAGFDKKLATIGKNLVEKLLPYFISDSYECPTIVLSEQDGTGEICLNDFVKNEVSATIREIGAETTMSLRSLNGEETFSVRLFKFYHPKHQNSRVSLVANLREVSGSAIHKYVPEFVEEFCEPPDAGKWAGRNFIVKAYVTSTYLDAHVSLERGGFDFHMDNDSLFGIAQTAIEKEAAEVAKNTLLTQVSSRQERKRERVQSYVDEEAPWHKEMLATADLSDMPYNPSDEEIEARLQKEKFSRERQIKRAVDKILTVGDMSSIQDDVNEIVGSISGSSKNDLVHYVALRRKVLDLLEKSLQTDESGKYSSEGTVHDIIFPRKGDTESTPFESHNLWILDERLNFTSYVSSDVPLNGGSSERADLIAYNRRVVFRGDNEPSNPVVIFEFKKPQRDDFVNKSSQEDPVQQIVRYVNSIRDGKYTTPTGRRMRVESNTPFYGYVVCDLTPKVESWLEREKDFKPMPDRLGWFQWRDGINLYIEVISWDKVLKDAGMRNRTFFEKLGI